MPAQVGAGSVASPLYAFDAVTFGEDDYVLVTEVPLVLDGTQPFSITGWVQPLSEGADMAVVTAGPPPSSPFTLGFARATTGSDLQLWLAWGVNFYSTLSIPVGGWHYLGVTYAPIGGGSGTVTFYLDGVGSGHVTVDAASASAGDGSFVLGNGAYCRCLSVSFWSTCLTEAECAPAWAPPAPAPELEACVDFSVVPARDRSGHDRPIVFSDEVEVAAVAPALTLTGTGDYVAPAASDALDPGGGPQPFSVQSWVYLSAPEPTYELAPAATVLANGDLSGPAGMAAYLAFDQPSGTYRWCTRLVSNVGAVVLTASTPLPAEQWHNVCVTFDGLTMTAYVDGTAAGTTTVTGVAVLAAPAVLIGAAPDSSGPAGASHYLGGALQAVAVWNVALSAAQVSTYASAEPGDGTTGCVAYFDLALGAPVNRVTGALAALIGEAQLAPVLQEYAPPEGDGPAPVPAAEAVAGPVVRWPSQEWLSGLEPAGSTSAAGPIAEDELERLIGEYRVLLDGAPEEVRERFEAVFTDNLRRGAAAVAAGTPPPGTVTHTRDGDEVVFSLHTEDGPVEIHRANVRDVNECTAWLISVIASAIGALFIVLGVGYSVVNLVQKFLPKFILASPGTTGAILTALLQEPLSAATFIKIIRSLAAAGQLTAVIGAGLSGVSWWSWAWTVASIALTIIGLWATGGWFLLWILAQLALYLGQMIQIIRDKPSGCYTSVPQAIRLRAQPQF
jgi:hypothetical protein